MAMQDSRSYASLQAAVVAAEAIRLSKRTQLRVTDQLEQPLSPARRAEAGRPLVSMTPAQSDAPRMRVIKGRSSKTEPSRIPAHGQSVTPGAVSWALEIVKQLAAEFYGLSVAELVAPSHRPDLVYARGMAMAVCRDVTPAGLIRIGRTFNRDHSTTMHSLKKMNAACQREPLYAEERACLGQAVMRTLARRSVSARAAAAGATIRGVL